MELALTIRIFLSLFGIYNAAHRQRKPLLSILLSILIPPLGLLSSFIGENKNKFQDINRRINRNKRWLADTRDKMKDTAASKFEAERKIEIIRDRLQKENLSDADREELENALRLEKDIVISSDKRLNRAARKYASLNNSICLDTETLLKLNPKAASASLSEEDKARTEIIGMANAETIIQRPDFGNFMAIADEGLKKISELEKLAAGLPGTSSEEEWQKDAALENKQEPETPKKEYAELTKEFIPIKLEINGRELTAVIPQVLPENMKDDIRKSLLKEYPDIRFESAEGVQIQKVEMYHGNELKDIQSMNARTYLYYDPNPTKGDRPDGSASISVPSEETHQYMAESVRIAGQAADGTYKERQYATAVSMHQIGPNTLALNYNGAIVASIVIGRDGDILGNNVATNAQSDRLREKGVDLDALSKTTNMRDWCRGATKIVRSKDNTESKNKELELRRKKNDNRKNPGEKLQNAQQKKTTNKTDLKLGKK